MNSVLFFILCQSAVAGNILSPGSYYPVKKEIKEAAPAMKPLESFYFEMQMDFDSFDGNSMGGKSIMSTHTDQLVKTKKLPKLAATDPLFSKDGLNDRTELTFERLVNSTKVPVPGLPAPFETKADVGVILASRPLILRGDGKGAPKKIDNLPQVKAESLASAKDPISRTTLSLILDEKRLLGVGAAAAQDTSCLSKLSGKKPGDKWKFTLQADGVSLDYDCQFEGWSEAQGKKIAVVKIKQNKQRTVRQQPNGTPGVAETDGEGEIDLDPATQESLLKMNTRINVEPAEEELNRLTAHGQAVPRNRSVMTNWNHIYPLGSAD
ncbi:MAG: hypothetical protein ACXVB9_19300 [Bdellovibrionota bacterium]